ncbi:MAG: hypothetical protein KDK38_10670 [Leptospiraceae bacterium]|nr:hypothetical protein [Leptospiraceae bacterium]
MKIVKQKQENMFALAGLSFTELKVIKDACELFGKQGSTQAEAIAKAINDEMNNVTI